MKNAIEVTNLTKIFLLGKRYRDYIVHPFQKRYITALKDVTFQLKCGELLCLLGSNGAGKSTLIKILCSLILPTAGKAFINGHDISKNGEKVRKSIGYVVCDERSFYWRLSGRQNLEFFASLYHLAGKHIKQRIDELLKLIDLEDAADRIFKNYSSGMKQKLAIARGLLHEPDILFLDEPSKSLDPAAAQNLQNFIKQKIITEQGKTVILATHNLQEAAALNHRIAIIHKGKIKAFGSTEDILKHTNYEPGYKIKIANPTNELLLKLKQLPCSIINQHSSSYNAASHYEFEIKANEQEVTSIIRTIVNWGGNIVSCYPKSASLADVFHTFTQEA